MKKLRQKVTSKLRALSRWRVTTPAIDHINVTADLIKEGADVVISASKPAGAPAGAARTGPGAAPRAPF